MLDASATLSCQIRIVGHILGVETPAGMDWLSKLKGGNEYNAFTCAIAPPGRNGRAWGPRGPARFFGRLLGNISIDGAFRCGGKADNAALKSERLIRDTGVFLLAHFVSSWLKPALFCRGTKLCRRLKIFLLLLGKYFTTYRKYCKHQNAPYAISAPFSVRAFDFTCNNTSVKVILFNRHSQSKANKTRYKESYSFS